MCDKALISRDLWQLQGIFSILSQRWLGKRRPGGYK